MTELPLTTPTESALAERQIALAASNVSAASAAVESARNALKAYAQGTAITKLIEAATCTEKATQAARDAARLLL